MNTISSSLKDYYVRLNELMENCVKILGAINQSLNTSSKSVMTNITNSDGENIIVKIPSFLYLDNRLEQLETNFTNLFNIPESGDAWFNNSSEIYKLQLVKSNTAPLIPEINKSSLSKAYFKDNNLLRDLVTPKTYIRMNIDNIPNNIHDIYMRKYIIHSSILWDNVSTKTQASDWDEIIYSYLNGIDYEIYESKLSMPIKSDLFDSQFKILNVEYVTEKYDNNTEKELIKVKVDTLKYYNIEDKSIEYKLAIGDFLCLGNEYAVYSIKNIETEINTKNLNDENYNSDSNNYTLTLEEYIGHVQLFTYYENNQMILKLYNLNYDQYHYIDIPLEENEHIGVAICTIYNNVRSTYSEVIPLDLSTIMMYDNDGNVIKENNIPISYIDYYKKYCKNIGDMIQGFTDISYPQLSNFTTTELNELVSSDSIIQTYVTNTLYKDDNLVLNVERINKHLIDDKSSEEIIRYHESKLQLQSELKSIQDNIDKVYNQLVSTDFSQEISVSQESLKSQLQGYYDEKIQLQNNISTLVDNINLLKGNTTSMEASKFRIRGVTEVFDKFDNNSESQIISYLHNTYNKDLDIIGIDVEYKYKSINKDTTSTSVNNDTIFTDWNKMQSIEKERYISFNGENNKYDIKYISYNSNTNIIKWNQIDIPITDGEDVVIRIRYKYSVGQPFINIYSPWSDEITITFPASLSESNELPDIIATNEIDTLYAKFNKTLVNDGYMSHINDKIIDNSQEFYHMPEHIYSGFNTSENKLISLKDKLISINNDLDEYKTLLKEQIDSKYKVYLEYDNNTIELHPNIKNKITINDSLNTSLNTFVKKTFNIIIKNEGDAPVYLYSIFGGDHNIKLIEYDKSNYNSIIEDYERVPLLVGQTNIKKDNIYYQTLGQYIYFRQNNIYNSEDYYLVSSDQIKSDTDKIKNGSNELIFLNSLNDYLGVNNKQALLPYKDHNNIFTKEYIIFGQLTKNNNNEFNVDYTYNKTTTTNNDYVLPLYYYAQAINNNSIENNCFALKYEHLVVNTKTQKGTSLTQLINISEINNISTNDNTNQINLNGAFLIPELLSQQQILCDTNNDRLEKQSYTLNVGKSLTIPVLFEYYLDSQHNVITNESNTYIIKTLSFDLRPSLFKDPENYTIEVKAISNVIESTFIEDTQFSGLETIDSI